MWPIWHFGRRGNEHYIRCIAVCLFSFIRTCISFLFSFFILLFVLEGPVYPNAIVSKMLDEWKRTRWALSGHTIHTDGYFNVDPVFFVNVKWIRWWYHFDKMDRCVRRTDVWNISFIIFHFPVGRWTKRWWRIRNRHGIGASGFYFFSLSFLGRKAERKLMHLGVYVGLCAFVCVWMCVNTCVCDYRNNYGTSLFIHLELFGDEWFDGW